MGVFDAALDRMFVSLGEAATWTPDGGSATSVSVIPAREDEIVGFGETRIHQDNKALFEARKSEMANPQAGDVLVFDGTTYTIKFVRTIDDRRLGWLLECYPA